MEFSSRMKDYYDLCYLANKFDFNGVTLTEALKKADQEKRGIAAICAAPSVLGDLGFLKGKKAVCYPGFESRLTGAEVLAVPVVTDGHITTSRGMGTAIAFALELTKRLKDEETAKQVGRSILYNV